MIEGSGKIQQKISKSSDYYIAVGNLNSQQVEVISQKKKKNFTNFSCNMILSTIVTSWTCLFAPSAGSVK